MLVMALFRTSEMYFMRDLWNDNETTESLLFLSRGKKEGVAGDSEESGVLSMTQIHDSGPRRLSNFSFDIIISTHPLQAFLMAMFLCCIIWDSHMYVDKFGDWTSPPRSL